MTVNVTKPAINVREKLAEVDKPTGLAGEAMLRAETPQEQFNLIGAGRRNLIINGDMRIAQRGTSINLANSSGYIIDRFNVRAGIGSGHTASQVADVPEGQGFLYSLKLTTGTAGSLSASSGNNYCTYMMESNDSSVIGDGTVGNIVTLSFWVKSSLTGVFGLAFGKDTSVLYPTSYAISSANTWEKKTITIPATTLTDFGDNGTSYGARIFWNWGAGSDYTTSTTDVWESADNRGGYDDGSAIQLVENSSATWQITGVQLEVGSVATPFEHRSYGEELALCQRYYYRVTNEDQGDNRRFAIGTSVDSFGNIDYLMEHPVTMRSRPALDIQAASNYREALSGLTASAMSSAHSSTTVGCIRQTIGSSTKFDARILVSSGSSSDNDRYIGWDAEL